MQIAPFFLWALCGVSFACSVLAEPEVRLLRIAEDGFAGSSVNVIAGLQNSLITYRDVQYAAFYVADGSVALAKRSLGSAEWTVARTELRGRVADAHNTVAIGVDGEGYLHVAWDHHNNALRYARGVEPGSLEVERLDTMDGALERSVTYPSFLALPDGDLLFMYRDGGSGRGNLALKRYDVEMRQWSLVSERLIDGEGQRSAYVSAATDAKGWLHLAWVWRDTPDVATNHDLSYARSRDGGMSWESVDGRRIESPITFASADYALRIGRGRSLMNPPSLCLDEEGRPYIANYWCPDGSDVPQYHLVYYDGEEWRTQQATQRTTAFHLSGTATKRPPISRSALVTRVREDGRRAAYLVYRDDERGGRVVAARCADLEGGEWTRQDLTEESVGAWEASYDAEQWRRYGELHLLHQLVEQRDGNDTTAAEVAPTTVSALVWVPEGLGE